MIDLASQTDDRTSYRAPRLPIGGTINGTFQVIGRSFVPLYALSSIVAILGIPFALILAQVTATMALAQVRHENPQFPPHIFAKMGEAYAVQILVSLFVFGVISVIALRHVERDGASFGASLRVAASRFFPMLIAALVVYTMMMIGFLLVVVPGIIVGAVYGLAPTLAVIERCGPFASLSRSAELTRTNRWRCLAVTAILLLVPGVIVGVIDGIIGAVFGHQVKLYASVFGSFLILPIMYVYPTVLAEQLKTIREGGGHLGVTEVF